MDKRSMIEKMIRSRRVIVPEGGFILPQDEAAEGGCGVIGMASSVQIAARHMLESLIQMRNRGNGKGGGIAAVGLAAEEFGVSQEVLENDYLLAIAYLEPSVRPELEQAFIHNVFEVDHVVEQAHLADFTEIPELEVRPPEVVIYFVRVRMEVLGAFIAANSLKDVPARRVEDEIVFQNTYRLNTAYYQSTGEKQASVLSHGCLLYTSPSPRDRTRSRMPSSA